MSMRGAKENGNTAAAAGCTRMTLGPGLTKNACPAPAGKVTVRVKLPDAAFAVSPAWPAGNMSVYAISSFDMFNVLAVPSGVLATAEFSFCGDPDAVNGRRYNPPSTERNLFCSADSPIVCQSAVPSRKETINRALSSVADRTLAIPLALESQNPPRLISPPPSV